MTCLSKEMGSGIFLEVLTGTRHTVANIAPGGHGQYCIRLRVESESLRAPSHTLGLHVIEMKEVCDHCVKL